MQGLGGTLGGLNRGASMSGNRATGIPLFPITGPLLDMVMVSSFVVSAGSYAITAKAESYAYIFGFGTGGGNVSADNGSGAGAFFKRYKVKPGDQIAYTLPSPAATNTDGGNLVVTLPDGTILTAQGGKKAVGAPGTGINGDINRTGGVGKNSAGGIPGGQSPDPGGGIPGAGDYGGAGAGFGDLIPALIGGVGGTGSGSGGGGPPVPGLTTQQAVARSASLFVFFIGV